MGKFTGYLFCSDLDGTLLNRDRRISAETEEAIRYFQENGGLFTMATGRWYDYLERYKPGFSPNTHVICLNGTVLCHRDTGEVLLSRPIRNKDSVVDDAKKIVTEDDEIWGMDVFVDGEDDGIGFSAEELVGTDFSELKKIVSEKEIFKLIFTYPDVGRHRVERMNEKYGDRYIFARSWSEGMEVVSHDAGKGAMMNVLRNMVEVPIHTTVAVGDYDNDIQMVKYADIGYAVENAVDTLKEVADRVTVDRDSSPIAKIISELD